MNRPIFSEEEAAEILDSALLKHYPDEYVERGENWELLATIFFNAGYNSAKEEENRAYVNSIN